jgi:transposase
MDPREQRGLIIAATCRLDRKDGLWLVPSQSAAGRKYEVNLAEKTCTCPDCQEGIAGRVCKHVHAVMFTMKRELGIDGSVTQTTTLTVTEKKTYRQHPAWSEAQVNEKDHFQSLLFDLCSGIPQPPREPGKSGRNPTLLSDVVFAAAFKVYSTVSTRRFMSDLRAAHEKGYLTKPIHYNCVCAYLESAAITPILMDLIVKASLPLKAVETEFAVDSTGFSTSRFVKWFDEKYGTERSGHDWVKAHLMVGVKTNVVTSIEIKDRDAADAPLFGPLVKATRRNFTIKEIAADKAYLSVDNLEAAVGVGARPFIPFKVNSTGGAGGLFEKLFHYFSLNQEEFYRHYHKRSNIESTNSMIKAKFGDHVRSRTDVSMRNEVLCKVLCHNLCCLISAMYELGIEPSFTEPRAESSAGQVIDSVAVAKPVAAVAVAAVAEPAAGVSVHWLYG